MTAPASSGLPPKLCGRVAVVETPVEERVDLRQLTHPANELRDGVLVDGHLALAVEQIVEVSVRVIPQPEAVGVQPKGGVCWHVGANAAVEHDLGALAAT